MNTIMTHCMNGLNPPMLGLYMPNPPVPAVLIA